MDTLLVVSSFGRFIRKQSLCDDSTWQTFMTNVELYTKMARTPCHQSVVEDLAQLIQELNEIYGTVNAPVMADDISCVVEEVVETSELSPSGFHTEDTERPGSGVTTDVYTEQDSAVTAKDEVTTDKEVTKTMDVTIESDVILESDKGTKSDVIPTISATPPIDITPKSDVTPASETKLEEVMTSENGTSPITEVQRIDPRLVQITASKAEIDRRIAAFQEHTRLDVNESNIREFRSAMSSEEVSESSARTDATFLRRLDSKSRVQVSRVVNLHGPQTRCPPVAPPGVDPAQQRSTSTSVAVEERLQNMEEHVGVGSASDKNGGASVFKRLKMLEERILHLESLSPEYFNVFPKKRKTDDDAKHKGSRDNDLSLSDINNKITALRHSLGLKDG